MNSNPLIVRELGLCDYLPTAQAMQNFTAKRGVQDFDELWLLQHHPVFTQGQAGKPEHILDPGDIPIIQTDRGGQITYHGPGQLIVYCLFNLHALNIGIRCLVHGLENSIIKLLSDYEVRAHQQEKAPGVYVEGNKICSLGLRVRRGFTYHGLALNIDMDLTPFNRINPCGYPNLAVTQLRDLTATRDISTVSSQVVKHLCKEFGYNPKFCYNELFPL